MKFNEARKIVEHNKQFEKVIARMVTTMGVEALNHFVKSFPDQGFTDESLVRWKPRKRMARKERGKPFRGILIQSGALWRSPKKRNLGRYAVVISSDLPYAKRQNDGGGGIVPRKFIGYSGALNRRIISRFDKQIKSVIK